MNQSEKLMRAFQYVDDELLTMAEKTKKKKRKKKKKKSLLSWGILAACLALVILLPVTAIAKNWFGLRDLFVPDYILEEEERQDTIGLSGYMESAEAQALREWNLFLQEYDKDRTILKALGNKPGGVDKRYSQYLVYTEEMAQKLEEILQKYDLEPHLELFKLNTLELVTDFAQKFVKKGNRIVGGYIYNDGTFQAEGVVPIDGCGMVSYQLRRVVKGVFDDVTLNIGRKEDYTEIRIGRAMERILCWRLEKRKNH